jgi:hypothetical protein
MLLTALLVIGCSTPNTLRICGQKNCSTGFFGRNGQIITTAHGLEEGEPVTVYTGYIYFDARVDRHIGMDVAVIETPYNYGGSEFCRRGEVKIGDKVRVYSYHKFLTARIVNQHHTFFYADTKLRHGDSGSVVMHRKAGCVLGIVRANTNIGIEIEALYTRVESGDI